MFGTIVQLGVFPATYTKSAKMAHEWPELIFSTHARGATHKKSSYFRLERIWLDLACLEMEKNVCL